MSNGEEVITESKSSVKITLNAKGEAQLEVKIYDGTTQEEATEISDVAINTWKDSMTKLGLSWT